MKTKTKIFILSLMLCMGTLASLQKASAQGGSVNFQVFYNELSPFGTWVDSPEYGYVWVPDVAPGFTPYATNGYWVFTDEGWTWVSNYSWGWAPFHYGRWYTDPNYGPIWVPDNEWGPGWVTWRRSEGYYGWAPIGPGVSISVAYGNGYNLPDNQWTFVRDRDFGRRNINNYYINSSRNVTIINNSTVINNVRDDRSRNVRYNAGPERNEVEKRVGKPIVPVAIKESSKPGQVITKNQLQIYRPLVQKTVSAGPKPAPVRVANLKDVKPAAQRSPGTTQQKGNQQEVHHPLPPVKTGTPAKQQPAQQQQKAQPVKQQPSQQPSQQQRQAQPAKQQQQAQPTKQQQQAQPARQQQQAQPARQQQQAQPARQQQQAQPARQQQQAQPARQQQQAQPARQQQQAQPARQQQQAQPARQQQQAQPARQQQQAQPARQQQQAQPARQQPQQQQHQAQPVKQQPQQAKPPQNKKEEGPPHSQ